MVITREERNDHLSTSRRRLGESKEIANLTRKSKIHRLKIREKKLNKIHLKKMLRFLREKKRIIF